MHVQQPLIYQRPQLSRAARLRFDAQSQCYILLSPERGLRLNDSANAILQRCNGQLSVQEIIEGLLEVCAVEHAVSLEPLVAPDPSPAEVTQDVLRLLLALKQRKLLVFHPAQ